MEESFSCRRLDKYWSARDDRGCRAVRQSGSRPCLDLASKGERVTSGKTAAPESAIDRSIGAASTALLALQRDDGDWVFELEADATIPAEYVLLRHYLGEPVDGELQTKIACYLRR